MNQKGKQCDWRNFTVKRNFTQSNNTDKKLLLPFCVWLLGVRSQFLCWEKKEKKKKEKRTQVASVEDQYSLSGPTKTAQLVRRLCYVIRNSFKATFYFNSTTFFEGDSAGLRHFPYLRCSFHLKPPMIHLHNLLPRRQ